MSSGDQAKPPGTFEERNPFDISRRSGTDVAAEIAKRMAAWKQARSRTHDTPGTIPSGAAKQPAPAAPMQPTRTSKSAAPDRAPQPQVAAPAARSSAGNAARVPYFALSAVRRAMPPAPSLKHGSARPQTPAGTEPALRPDDAAIPAAAPALDQASTWHDEAPLDEMPLETPDAARPSAEPETPRADPFAIGVASSKDSPLEAAAPPQPVEPDDNERRRAEARAIKARWMAAHDPDALLDTSAGSHVASTIETAMTTAQEIASGKPALADEDVAESPAGPPGEKPAEAASHDEQSLDKPAEPDKETAPEIASEIAAPIAGDGPDKSMGRPEPSDVRVARVTPALLAGRDVAWETPALGLAALDEMAGRTEPTFDAPVARAAPDAVPDGTPEADDEAAEMRQPAASTAAEPGTSGHRPVLDGGLSIAALDEAAGRKEPTFDQPVAPELVQRAAPEIEPPVPANQPCVVETRKEAAGTAGSRLDEVESPQPAGIAARDETAGRKEPTLDGPVRPAKTRAAATQPAAPHIALRPIETRIEARRIDTLRADPQMSVRRPIFPHIEPDEWDVLPVVAAEARRERGGAGWAIGLGAILLIAGITAPAAIWQQGRSVQDQVALVNPAPAPQQAPAPTATTTPTTTTTAPAPAQPTVPEAPPPEPSPAVTAQDTPPVTAQEPSAAKPAAPEPEAGQRADNPQPAPALGSIGDGEDVNEAPVRTPPPPTVSLASKPVGTGTPMVARPFVPEGGDGPFLRAPTTGATSVPVAGAPIQPDSAGVKPNLMGQLKPKATISAAKPVTSKPRPAARKPKPFFQQSPEQMFETLIDTLSEGKPVNPATKPASPSTRR
ncbi:MAG TPA: hypothetical protein VJ790_09045 [Dongiaceae bacterium]|nr:hypothetical protein [Dongiaceae bacterium]